MGVKLLSTCLRPCLGRRDIENSGKRTTIIISIYISARTHTSFILAGKRDIRRRYATKGFGGNAVHVVTQQVIKC